MAGLSTLALGYGAGALSTLSPCVLPLLPMVLIGALQQGRWGPLALALGLATGFSVIGISVAAAGTVAGIDPAIFRAIVAASMAGFGLILLVPALQVRFAVAAGPVADRGQTLLNRVDVSGARGQFVLGALLGLVWSPCVGPTLGAAVGLAAQGEGLSSAAVTMVAFGLGAATPIVILAYGAQRTLLARRDALARLGRVAKPVMGALLLAVGLLVLTGLDKRVETTLTNAMPAWLVDLTTSL